MNEQKKITKGFNGEDGSSPSRSLSDSHYTKFHLGISRGQYDQVFKQQNIATYQDNPEYKVQEFIDPTIDDLMTQIKKVGHLYGWDKRAEYQPENHDNLRKMLNDEKTRLFIFTKGTEKKVEVGFCLTTDVPAVHKGQGTPKRDVIEKFKSKMFLPANSNVIEINKIGLYDEFTKQGHGNAYLGIMMRVLFERTGYYDMVYLDTRDTNHSGVRSFYKKNGIEVFFEEELQNDVIINEAPKQSLDNKNEHFSHRTPKDKS